MLPIHSNNKLAHVRRKSQQSFFSAFHSAVAHSQCKEVHTKLITSFIREIPVLWHVNNKGSQGGFNLKMIRTV